MSAIVRGAVLLSFLLWVVGCNEEDPVKNVSYLGHYLRANQLGYEPEAAKVALLFTDAASEGKTFALVRTSDGEIVHTGKVGASRDSWGKFPYVYPLDFTRFKQAGTYRIEFEDETSYKFQIKNGIYETLFTPSLSFLQVNQSGDTDPYRHGPSHLNDATARIANGSQKGNRWDAAGGWYDAGDYLKFVTTTGATASMLLVTWVHHSDRFASLDVDDDGTPDLLQRAKVGLDWLVKMWDSDNEILYMQVGDVTDHEQGWRLPGVDDDNGWHRKIYAASSGKGANLAGKAAAALALGYVAFSDSSKSWYDAALAQSYLTAAEELYAFGQANPQVQEPTGDGPHDSFYAEDQWKDDMALAAIELYRATGTESYATDAVAYAEKISYLWPDVLTETSLDALAHYEIGSLVSSYKSTAVAYLKEHLSNAAWVSKNNAPWGLPTDEFYWGIGRTLTAMAMQAKWLEELNGNDNYNEVTQLGMDFMLGANPWGVCMVTGIGANYLKRPHHNIAAVNKTELAGVWGEGAVQRADFEASGITLDRVDEYALFHDDRGVYHDDYANYMVNEPTIFAQAVGLGAAAWLSD